MKSEPELTFSKIEIEVIPHEQQRYETAGDWYMRDGVLVIKVSKLPNDSEGFMSFAIVIHELIEVALCKKAGVTQKMVDDFDMAYEKTRHPNDFESEPGDHAEAPYRDQHCFATAVERMFIAACKIAWVDYETAIYSLPDAPDKSAPV